ncbi:hypothetical protein PHYBOEH_003502 [Phytophthora boehmeriae]|uniref:Uncharacterized protein n=1 Tax=Phytophthora boehmeriae TaxID=109152 RepID=A0A8T1XE10_9STRA|nr:hypothetical protein PHYBOEH_003502 [Phytophthora boehmeriae]
MLPLLSALSVVVLALAAAIGALGISRSTKQRRRLRHYDSSQAETAGRRMASRATCPEFILQFVLDALHHLTGLPLLMVNQPDHCLSPLQHMRADRKKNAELLARNKRQFIAHSASWSDDEAPEEELDMCSDSEDEDLKQGIATASAQSQLFDGLEFYLAVTQVRERTVRSVMALGMAKTINTLRERKQRQSIAVIEQQYPDFTCLPTKQNAVHQAPAPQMDLLAALRLPSTHIKTDTRGWNAEADDGRVRRTAALTSPQNISRVA